MTIGNGVADATDYIQNAINCAQAAGGGAVQIDAGIFPISSTLSITKSCVSLKGVGRGGAHDVPGLIQASTRLVWIGPPGGTMISIGPAAGSPSNLQENGIDGIFLDGSLGLAAYGVCAHSTSNGTYKVSGQEFSEAMFETGCAPWLTGSNTDYGDCQSNDIWLYGRQVWQPGRILQCDGVPGISNTSLNRFHQVRGVYGPNTALAILNGDNNVFSSVFLWRFPGGTGYGVVLAAADTPINCARANLFIQCSPGAGGFYAEGTEHGAAPSRANKIMWYDKENNAPNPAYGSGASLAWACNDLTSGSTP